MSVSGVAPLVFPAGSTDRPPSANVANKHPATPPPAASPTPPVTAPSLPTAIAANVQIAAANAVAAQRVNSNQVDKTV